MSYSYDHITFLINPKSGHRKSIEIKKALQKAEPAISYFILKNKDDLQQFFSSLHKNIKVVVICGGDGTVNSVLEFAVHSNLVFVVFPGGSGNGFAREMGYTKDIGKLLKIIKRGKTKEIDILKVNNNYCVNLAGIGFDSFIAHKFEKSNRRGLFSYVRETIKGFFEFDFFNAVIQADNTSLQGNYFMLSLANTRQFGNNVIIAPQAIPNDGYIDLVVIKKFPKIYVPILVLKLLSKKGKDSKYIRYIRAKEISITSDYLPYHIDGEPLRNATNTTLNAHIETIINMIDSQG